MSDAVVHSLAYVSRASADFDGPALTALGDHAAAKNLRLGLTGYLFYIAPNFVQFLEGPEPSLRQVMEAIEKDSRHRVLRTVRLPAAADRLFPDWSMRSSGADHRQTPGWSTRDDGPLDASAVRLEHVLLSVLLHTPVEKLQSSSVTGMIAKLFADLAARERCALAQT
jgi:hypothetical protein